MAPTTRCSRTRRSTAEVHDPQEGSTESQPPAHPPTTPKRKRQPPPTPATLSTPRGRSHQGRVQSPYFPQPDTLHAAHAPAHPPIADLHAGGDSEEDEDGDDFFEVPYKSEAASSTAPSTPSTRDSGDLIISLDNVPTITKKVRGVTKADRMDRRQVHQVHILCWIARLKMLYSPIHDALVKSAILSIIPRRIFGMFPEEADDGDKDHVAQKDHLIRVMHKIIIWWQATMTLIPDVPRDPKRSSSCRQALLRAVEERQANISEYTLLLLVALNLLGVKARWIVRIPSLPLTFTGAHRDPDAILARYIEAAKSGPADEDKKRSILAEAAEKECATWTGRNGRPAPMWCEVLLPSSPHDRWVCLDPVRDRVDEPSLMEPGLKAAYPISYILAIGEGFRLRDVTQRYGWNERIRKGRLPREKSRVEDLSYGLGWWTNRINAQGIIDVEMKEIEAQEDEDFKGAVISEQMPTTYAGFINHPLYVLERNVGKRQALYPNSPVIGRFRGDPVYPRNSVKELKTTEAWLKEGRVILDDEEPSSYSTTVPVTLLKQRARNMNLQEGLDAPKSPLYGEWQTKKYVAPPVVDGIIPKNAFGNVDLYKPWMLPKGAVHLPVKGLIKMAKKLEIDYADAVVGFSFHSRRCAPVLEGIVVAKEYAPTLLTAHQEAERKRERDAEAKRQREVLGMWKRLVMGLRLSHRLKQSYGGIQDVTE